MKNKYTIEGGVVRMIVESRMYGTHTVFFDEEDVSKIKHIKWSLKKKTTKNTTYFYIAGWDCVIAKNVYLHRYILKAPTDSQVDHKNANTLDNRKKNLRLVTDQENKQNRRRSKGYYLDKRRGSWVSTIGLDGKVIYLGRFNTEAEARAAYVAAKPRYHPSAPPLDDGKLVS